MRIMIPTTEHLDCILDTDDEAWTTKEMVMAVRASKRDFIDISTKEARSFWWTQADLTRSQALDLLECHPDDFRACYPKGFIPWCKKVMKACGGFD